MTVPYTFGNATAALPLSQLDTNFATPITVGSTPTRLGDTVSAISGVNLSNSSATAANSSASRILASRFADMVNVKDFGAIGNGIADDTAAIQAAINYAQTIKAWVYFPPVELGYLTGPLTIGQTGTNYTCHFQGGGFDPSGAAQSETGQYTGQSLIKLKPGNNQNLLTINSSAAPPMFRNITFQGDASNQTGTSYVVYLPDTTQQAYYTYACWMEDCFILSGKTCNLYIGSWRGSGHFKNVWIQYCQGPEAVIIKCFDQIFYSTQIGPNTASIGLSIYSATQIQLMNCVLFMNDLGMKVDAGCGVIQATNCVFDQNNTYGLYIIGGSAAYAFGARTFANCAWQRNGQTTTDTYSDIYVSDDKRLSLIGACFAGPMGLTNVVKYNIEIKTPVTGSIIRLDDPVFEANTGTTYGTAFANSYESFIYAGDTKAYIGMSGGTTTLSTVINGAEVTRANATGVYVGGKPNSCSLEVYNKDAAGWIRIAGDPVLNRYPYIQAAGTAANVSLVLSPKGSDSLLLKSGDGNVKIQANDTGLGFFAATPIAKPTVTGSRGANAALASLLTALAGLGLLTDSSS